MTFMSPKTTLGRARRRERTVGRISDGAHEQANQSQVTQAVTGPGKGGGVANRPGGSETPCHARRKSADGGDGRW